MRFDVNVVTQCLSIIGKALIIFAIAYFYAQKEKGLIKSLIAYLFYHDDRGLRWLSENMIYIIMLILGVGEIYLFLGLLEQFPLHQVQGKSAEMQAGGLMTNLGVLSLIIERYLVSKNIKVRIFFSGKKVPTRVIHIK